MRQTFKEKQKTKEDPTGFEPGSVDRASGVGFEDMTTGPRRTECN